MRRFYLTFGLSILFFAVLGFLFYQFWVITLNIVGGFLVYSLIDACQQILDRNGIKGKLATLVLVLLFSSIALSLLLFIGIPFFEQIQSLTTQLPAIIDQFNGKLAEFSQSAPFVIPLYEAVKSRIWETLQSVFAATGSIVTSLVTIPIIAIILLHSGESIKKNVMERIPNNYFEISVTVVHRIIAQVQSFIVAKSIETLLLTVIYAIGFWIVGLPSALILAIIGGMLNLIPYLGPLLTIVPVGLAAMISGHGFSTFGLAIVVLAVARLIDDAFLQTYLVSRFVDVHPLIVVIMTLVGGEVLGPIGLVVAIPVYVVAQILFSGTYEYLIAYERHQFFLTEQKREQEAHAHEQHHQVQTDIF